MAAYPTLSSGVAVCIPWTMRREYANISVDMDCGWRYSYNERGTPLDTIIIQYSGLSDADRQTLEDFWDARGGPLEDFTFTNPDTGVTYPKCRFEGNQLEFNYDGPNENSVRVTIKQIP